MESKRVHLGFTCEGCGVDLQALMCPGCGEEGTLRIARGDFLPVCGGQEGATIGVSRMCSPCLEAFYNFIDKEQG